MALLSWAATAFSMCLETFLRLDTGGKFKKTQGQLWLSLEMVVALRILVPLSSH